MPSFVCDVAFFLCVMCCDFLLCAFVRYCFHQEWRAEVGYLPTMLVWMWMHSIFCFQMEAIVGIKRATRLQIRPISSRETRGKSEHHYGPPTLPTPTGFFSALRGTAQVSGEEAALPADSAASPPPAEAPGPAEAGAKRATEVPPLAAAVPAEATQAEAAAEATQAEAGAEATQTEAAAEATMAEAPAVDVATQAAARAEAAPGEGEEEYSSDSDMDVDGSSGQAAIACRGAEKLHPEFSIIVWFCP